VPAKPVHRLRQHCAGAAERQRRHRRVSRWNPGIAGKAGDPHHPVVLEIWHCQIDPSSDSLIGAIGSLSAFACVHESKIGIGLKCGFLVRQKFKASYLLNGAVKVVD